MILCVGNLNFDILLPLPHLPSPHEKMTCPEAVTGFGGSAANTAYWLARMGIPVAMAGAVGRDPLGAAHLEELKAAGVYVNAVDRVKAPTGLAVVFAQGEEKRMVRVPGANGFGKLHTDALLGCSVMYLSGINRDLLLAYATAAPETCKVFCGGKSAGDERLLRICRGAILNSDELAELTGQENPAEGILALDLKEAAVTLPGGGCLVSRGIEVRKVEAPQLDPVDRTGAGDAFAAGFLAGVAVGMRSEDCGNRGNRLASSVIMGWGARPEIGLAELKE